MVAPPQGLGCMGLSELRGPVDRDESIATVRRAVELGVTLFDTSNIYGFKGANEVLLGEALRGRWSEVQIVTKFGIVRDDPDPSILPGATEAGWTLDGRPESVRPCLEASLDRLGTDIVDLYLLHRADPNVPIEETVGAMAALVQAGLVKHIGLSEVSPSTIRRAHSVCPIAAVQSEYSIWTRDIEDEILPTLRELGIGLIPYSPLGRGFLTGTITSNEFDDDDFRNFTPWFRDENFRHNVKIADRLKAFAESHGWTGAQLALAWHRAQGSDIVPIPGTKRRKWLEQNVIGSTITLSPDDLAEIERIAPRGSIAGTRYVDMDSVNG